MPYDARRSATTSLSTCFHTVHDAKRKKARRTSTASMWAVASAQSTRLGRKSMVMKVLVPYVEGTRR